MTQSKQIRVFSVDDHPLLHEGLATVIRHQADMLLVGQATSGAEGIQRFREHQPDVMLMDLRLPDMSGIEAMSAIRAEFPAARVIILTTSAEHRDIEHAFRAGAYGYLLKSTPPKELMDAIREIHAGKKRIPAALEYGSSAEASVAEQAADKLVHRGALRRLADHLFGR